MGMRVQYVSLLPTAVSLLLFVLMHAGMRAERVRGQLNGHARAICFLCAHCSKPTAV